MRSDVDVSVPARLIGEPARAAMLTALLSGQALAAGELARVAGVSAATASEHLGRLRAGGLVEVVAAGRHRYYRLASPEVATAIEALATTGITTGCTIDTYCPGRRVTRSVALALGRVTAVQTPFDLP